MHHPLINSRAKGLLHRVHVDLVGPLPSGVRGHRYWLTIVDDFSRYGWAILLHSKHQAKHKLIEWMAQVQRDKGVQLRHVHGDRGGEFLNSHLLGHLQAQGVTYSFSNPHTPQQNGIAEARNKQVSTFTRALLIQAQAPISYWSYAVLHSTYLNNLVPHRLLQGMTPSEAWHQAKPDMRRLRVWGCTAHVLVNKEDRRKMGGKLGPVTKAHVFIGLNPLGPGWLMYDPVTRKEVPSSDVVFQEHLTGFKAPAGVTTPPLDWAHFMGSETVQVPTDSRSDTPSTTSGQSQAPSTPAGAYGAGDSSTDSDMPHSPAAGDSSAQPSVAQGISPPGGEGGSSVGTPRQESSDPTPMTSRAVQGLPAGPNLFSGYLHQHQQGFQSRYLLHHHPQSGDPCAYKGSHLLLRQGLSHWVLQQLVGTPCCHPLYRPACRRLPKGKQGLSAQNCQLQTPGKRPSVGSRQVSGWSQ